jgi:hypothetical protein
MGDSDAAAAVSVGQQLAAADPNMSARSPGSMS